MRFVGGGHHICIDIYIYICMHRGKEREGTMKGGGVHGGYHIYIYV